MKKAKQYKIPLGIGVGFLPDEINTSITTLSLNQKGNVTHLVI